VVWELQKAGVASALGATDMTMIASGLGATGRAVAVTGLGATGRLRYKVFWELLAGLRQQVVYKPPTGWEAGNAGAATGQGVTGNIWTSGHGD